MQNLVDQVCEESGLSVGEVEAAVEKLATMLRSIPATMMYHYLGPEVEQFYSETGLRDSDAFHRLVLSKLIDSFDRDQLPLRLPDSMAALYAAEFARIRRNLEGADFAFSWDNDLFAKDMAIASGRLIPAGPGLLEISGVPRSLLFKRGIGQFFRFLAMLLFGLGGRAPLLTIHIHLSNVQLFNPEGWEKSYKVIGEILELNPEMKGLMRHAWFFDPVIAEISPKLAYLREIPEQFGAGIYYHSDEDADSGALLRSARRRALFEAGEYTPRVYYLLWPRERLIRYARTL